MRPAQNAADRQGADRIDRAICSSFCFCGARACRSLSQPRFGCCGSHRRRLQRQHLEQNTLPVAERIGDVIKHGTTEYVLHNHQEGPYKSIPTMAAEPGMEKIRIFDQEGRITCTTNSAEQNHVVDTTAEACYVCHARWQA